MKSFFLKKSFKFKIIVIVLSVTMIGIGSTVITAYVNSKKSLMNMGSDQLNSIASISKTRSVDFIKRTKTFTALLGKDRLSEGLILAYESGFYGAGKIIGKDEVLKSNVFTKLNQIYKDRVFEQINSYEISKYLLVNIQGQVVFSSELDEKGVFAGRSLTNGKFKDLKLSQCAKDALKSTSDIVYSSDTEYNALADDTHTMYCTRIIAEFDHLSEGIKKGDLMGAILVELNDHHLTKLLSDRAGMGTTGQAYLMGLDGHLKSDFFINSEKFNSLNSYKNNELISNQIIDDVKNKNKEFGNLILINPNGKEVMASYFAVDIDGIKLIVVAEKETNEIFAPINEFLRNIILVSSIVIIFLVFSGFYLSTILTKPILDSIETLKVVCNDLNEDSIDLNLTADVLSGSAQSQAKDLQSTVQAIDQISSTIEQNSSNAKSSANVSDSSLVVVENGKQVVSEMIKAMDEINLSNDSILNGVDLNNKKLEEIIDLISEISNKTQVINDIVFQTKLLSFNASVEAARAGENGKGFAVVAEEVGNLATLSGDSSKAISELLQQSIDRVNVIIKESKNDIYIISKEASLKVKMGQDTAYKCEKVFEQIFTDVAEVSRMMGDISSASTEQNIGMAEINKAMNRLSAGTEQSTESAEKSLDAAKKLNSRSNSLQELVEILHSSIHGKLL